MPSLSSMPAFSTEGVVDSCRVSIVRLDRTDAAGREPRAGGGRHSSGRRGAPSVLRIQ